MAWNQCTVHYCLNYLRNKFALFRQKLFLIDFQSAITVHNFAGFILSVSYLLFFFGNLFTKNGKYYRVKIRGLDKRLQKQINIMFPECLKEKNPPFPYLKTKV
jgi:thiosulfate reductase cytochrome b subunit